MPEPKTPERLAAEAMQVFKRAHFDPVAMQSIERVAAQAIAAEREACAALEASLEAKLDRMCVIGGPEEQQGVSPDWPAGYAAAIRDFAAAIRARTP